MGFVKSIKDMLLKPFRTSNVQHISSKDVGVTDRNAGGVHNSSKLPPGPVRAAWKGKMRRNTSLLTPVPEEQDQEQDTKKAVKIAKKTESVYISNASGLGLGESGNSQHIKKTHIMIDLRELMTAGACDSDDELDISEKSGTSSEKIKHADAMPPSPYVKRQNKLVKSKSIRVSGGGLSTKHFKISGLAATDQICGESCFGKQVSSGSSAMGILDDIIKNEAKLDKPYLTKDNVDTTLPGGITVSQKAGSSQIEDDQYTPSVRMNARTTIVTNSNDVVIEQCIHDVRSVDSDPSIQSPVYSQIQHGCSSDQNPVVHIPWPMKNFRNNNVTDITIRGVTADRIVVGRNDVGHGVYHTHDCGETFDDTIPENKVGSIYCGSDMRKEVSFASETSGTTSKQTGGAQRIPSTINLSKPILIHQPNPVDAESHNGIGKEDQGHSIAAQSDTVHENECKTRDLVRSKSARNYNKVDVGRNLLLKEALPRTSFFSCHEQTLKEAGYNVKELERAAKMVRIKQKKVARSKEDSDSAKKHKAVHKTSCDLRRIKSFMSLTRSNKRRNKMVSADQNSEYSGANILVNPEPLLVYLKLVLEKPSEYSAMKEAAASPAVPLSKSSSTSFPCTESTGPGVEHPQPRQRNDSLVDLNRAYQKCQENFSPPESLILQAVNELGNKTWDSHPICIRYEADKRTRLQASKSKHHPLVSNRGNVTQLYNGSAGVVLTGMQVQEQPLTQIEKARGDVERWIKTLSMVQVIKAKEIALGLIGEEERSIRHWWNNNKHCKYIRCTDSTVEVV